MGCLNQAIFLDPMADSFEILFWTLFSYSAILFFRIFRKAYCLMGSKWIHRKPLIQRFMNKINKTSTCWLWTGSTDRFGHGCFQTGSAHVFSYEFFVGPVPDGKELHHMCEVPACANPWHLEPVTRREHLIVHGRIKVDYPIRCSKSNHALFGTNLYITPHGVRRCRICMEETKAKYWASTHPVCIPV